jgi:biopolymer transport protein TolR
MAATLMSGGARTARYARRRSYRPMSEINVTPMVDVMLVLLIIFMVTAPLLTVGVPVDLPKTQAEVLSDPDEPLVISVNSQGQLFLQETPVEIDGLAPRLMAITQNKLDTRIYVRGDRTIQYGRVMEVMGALTVAGFTQVALIAELPDVTGQAGAAPGATAQDAGTAANGTAN